MSKELIRVNSNIFACPVCNCKMSLTNYNSLICKNNHCYDLSKSGYANFLSKPVSNDYDKEMLSSRKLVMESEFFNPLLDKIISSFSQNTNYILDAGCGEGTHLDYILSKTSQNITGVGIDISKAGIMLASRNFKNAIWSVGDLAATPYQTNTFDVVLNILSPSNYKEFLRILSPNGILIKVIPNSSYLKELREIFYAGSGKETYSNADTIKLFSDNFSNYSTETISYKFEVQNNLLENIIKMSPLSWKVSEQKLTEALTSGIKEITMDFTILKGVKTK